MTRAFGLDGVLELAGGASQPEDLVWIGISLWLGGSSRPEFLGHPEESGQTGLSIRLEGSNWMGDSTMGEGGTDAGRTTTDVRTKKGANPKYDILASDELPHEQAGMGGCLIQ